MARSVAQGKGGIIDVCGVAPARFQSLRDAGCGVNALSRLHKMALARRPDKTRKRRIRQSIQVPDITRRVLPTPSRV